LNSGVLDAFAEAMGILQKETIRSGITAGTCAFLAADKSLEVEDAIRLAAEVFKEVVKVPLVLSD